MLIEIVSAIHITQGFKQMEKLLNKLERKYGRYAINNLSLYIIIAYVIGYILQMTGTMDFLRLNPYDILHGQIWRIVTWIIVPPSSLGIFTIIMLFFYYSLGKSLEMTWGAFRYNVYIFSGMIFTLIGAFFLYVFFAYLSPNNPQEVGYVISMYVTTYYVNMSIFLVFAALYPNMQVLLYFFIPIKIKWMAIVYAVLMIIDVFSARALPIIIIRGVILFVSLLNFLIFFASSRNRTAFSYAQRKRAAEFKRAVNEARNANSSESRFSRQGQSSANGISKHKCSICGRTELDNPDLEFRFCSKCNGNYEYCNEHLFSHKHKE